ncbi:hypothetical protein A6V36_33925 [Paraburkholderia ginsengiterrae]|uniref:Uncharacterized protein n=1 Tax=Paraburkholderia ginsengiterrae TaxID=1462993 RepID=A0A1A9N901_9BURK|nr:hypothetical protein A6V36_33925 [Paraburkholderia ginsengiterrae]OAJ61558.1 hypothetical protein A6V37_24700 [Paraburkholderia ginsengiterrae]
MIECARHENPGQARALQSRHKPSRHLSVALNPTGDDFELATFLELVGAQYRSIDRDSQVAGAVAFSSASEPSNPELFVLDVLSALNGIFADCCV